MSWVSNTAGITIYNLIKACNLVQKRMICSNLGFQIIFILITLLRMSKRGIQSWCHTVQWELDWHFSKHGLSWQTVHWIPPKAKVEGRKHPCRGAILIASIFVHIIRDLPKDEPKKDHSEIPELLEGQFQPCYRCCHRGTFSISLK